MKAIKGVIRAGLLLFMTAGAGMGCPVCERNQAGMLKGIAHSGGPQSSWDYLIVWLMAGIALLALFYTVRYLVRPGEASPGHIKRMVVNDL